MQPAASLEPQAFLTYTGLMLLHESWAGQLLLLPCMGRDAQAAMLAGLAAGACLLAVDGDAGRHREAMRDGTADFSVNALDEALRILKNEVRQRRPVSVALRQDAYAALAECRERGVQPDCILLPAEAAEELAHAALSLAGAATTKASLAETAGGDRVSLPQTVRNGTAGHAAEQAGREASEAEAEVPLLAISRQWRQQSARLFPREPLVSRWRRHEDGLAASRMS